MIKWIVQSNLTSMIDDNNKMKDVCKKHNFDFESIKVIPFSGIIPEFDINVPTIFYGGTGWINNIYNKHPNHKGIFFNPDSTFTFWINKYKEKALNYGAVETTFKKIANENYPDDKLLFIRPVAEKMVDKDSGLLKTFHEKAIN
jgi:hypothetical protein